MSVLTDLILAGLDEAPSVSESEQDSDRWPRISVPGMDQVVLCSLWAILRGDAYRDEDVDAFTLAHEESAEGPWTVVVPAGLVGLLAGLPPDDMPRVAVAWSATEELQGTGPEELQDVLKRIVEFARRAVTARATMLMWTCL